MAFQSLSSYAWKISTINFFNREIEITVHQNLGQWPGQNPQEENPTIFPYDNSIHQNVHQKLEYSKQNSILWPQYFQSQASQRREKIVNAGSSQSATRAKFQPEIAEQKGPNFSLR